MATVRVAEDKDISSILDIARKFYVHSEFDKIGFTVDRDGFYNYCSILMRLPSAIIMVLEEEEKVIGSISGILQPLFLNPSVLMITENWWWVDPEYRGSRGGIKLEKELIQWGKERGACKIIMSTSHSPKEESLKNYYIKMGYTYLESHFIKEI